MPRAGGEHPELVVGTQDFWWARRAGGEHLGLVVGTRGWWWAPRAGGGHPGLVTGTQNWWWAPRAGDRHPGLTATTEQLHSHLHLQLWGSFATLGRVEWESEAGESTMQVA